MKNIKMALNIRRRLNLEKETTHTTTHNALTVAKDVEFGYELVKVMASLSDRCQVSLQ